MWVSLCRAHAAAEGAFGGGSALAALAPCPLLLVPRYNVRTDNGVVQLGVRWIRGINDLGDVTTLLHRRERTEDWSYRFTSLEATTTLPTR